MPKNSNLSGVITQAQRDEMDAVITPKTKSTKQEGCKMTKKHFEAIAEIMRRSATYQVSGEEMLEVVSGKLADYFAEQNPNFKRDKFINACDPLSRVS